MNLTKQDKKIIKHEKRISYVFSAMILLFGALFNLFFITIQSKKIETLLSINIGIIALSFLIVYSMNRKYNADLKDGTKVIKKEQIKSKKTEISYEAGSGALYIPILGNLFPKLWGQEMRAFQKYYLNINGYLYDVEKEIYDSIRVGDFIEMYYSKYSKTLLEIKKAKTS